MKTKLNLLDAMMQHVAQCKLCCSKSFSVDPEKRLINLISKKPDGFRYGEIPTKYTDWANRLDSKIVFVLQDWGPADEPRRIGNASRRWPGRVVPSAAPGVMLSIVGGRRA